MAKVVKRKMKGYKLPDPLPQGEILEDISKKKWKLGTSIGKGGFGEIYSSQPFTDKSNSKSGYPYVVKIEPHANGPLFVEMHFYMRVAKKTDIDAFKGLKNLKSLGMPVYEGSGSHEYKNEKYRFLVLQKYGSDIWKLFLENNRKFPASTVYIIGLQILDVLEYIHSKGYIHGDIKGSNILLSLDNPNQVYLVDFGLAEHYSTAAEFKPEPKKAHNGTIEYLSRDAHLGVQTRRGDLEILIYNLIQWLGCTLPWETDLKDVKIVHQAKEKHMSDIPGFLKACFGKQTPPDAIKKYLQYLESLKFNAEPDYEKVRKILLAGLKSAGGSLKTPLEFKATTKRQSENKISDSGGKKQKLEKKKIAGKSKVDDQDLEENGAEKLPAMVSTRKLRGKVQDYKKMQQSSEDESSQEDNARWKKVDKSKPKQDKKKQNEKLQEKSESEDSDESNDETDTLSKFQQQKRKKQDGKESKTRRKLVKRNEQQEEESGNESDTSTYTDEMKRIKNKIKSKNGKDGDDESIKPKIKKGKTLKTTKNKMEDQENETTVRKVRAVRQNKHKEEESSAESDTSTYTAEMKRIKDKIETVKLSKARKKIQNN